MHTRCTVLSWYVHLVTSHRLVSDEHFEIRKKAFVIFLLIWFSVVNNANSHTWLSQNALEMVLRHRSFRLLNPNEDPGEEEEAFTMETNYDHLLRASRQESIEAGPVSTSSLNKSSAMQFRHQDLLGAVLELPEAKTPHQVMLDIYLDAYDKFGDAVSCKMPIHQIKDLYVVKREEKFVSLADADSHKTGEEMLQDFLTVSREEAERRRANGDDDDDDRSDRSSRSDQSDLDDGISPFLGDSKITVSTTLSDPSMGIKLKFKKLPKLDPIPPEPEPLKQPEKSPDKLTPPEKLDTKPKRLWNPTHQLTHEEAFDSVDLPYRAPLVFHFSYLGSDYRCEYNRTIRTVFDEVPDTGRTSYLHSRMSSVGKSRLRKRGKNELHRHQSTLQCTL